MERTGGQSRSVELELKALDENHKELQHKVNTLEGMAAATFAKTFGYSLLVLALLLMNTVAWFLGEQAAPFTGPAVLLLGSGIGVLILLLIYNAILLHRGLRRMNQDLKHHVPPMD